MNAPTLETARLRLRGWRESDFDAFAAMMADPDCARFLTGDQRPQIARRRGVVWRCMSAIDAARLRPVCRGGKSERRFRWPRRAVASGRMGRL